MPLPSHQRHEIAQAIEHYLLQHPNASDTIEGIRQWWLPDDWQVDLNEVAAAVEQLKEQGRIRRHTNSDNHVLFWACTGQAGRQQ